MAAQDVASNAAADVAGAVGEAGGFAAKAIDWAVTKGPGLAVHCLLYTSPSPRDATLSRMPSSA